MILVRVGNRNFYFANSRSAFPKRIKMAMKGAKMRVIVNSNMQPKGLVAMFLLKNGARFLSQSEGISKNS